MRAVGAAALLCFGLLPHAPATQTPAPGGPPGTDIYLLPLTGGIRSMRNATPVPVSLAPGYDNQPNFSPDGNRILFAASRDGKQIDVFVFSRSNGQVSQLTETAENENSPTWLPPGNADPGAFSVVRTEPDKTQRLWRFDAEGRNPRIVLTEVKPVGYHAWVDADTVALFVLGPPSTLRIARVSSQTAAIVAEGIGRSLHRIPGAQAVSFVHSEASGEQWVKRIEIGSRAVAPLVEAADGAGERDMAWLPDGRTILMSSGTKVFSWTPGETEWTEVFDAAARGLGAVTRLAVSPKGDAVAIVVAEPPAK